LNGKLLHFYAAQVFRTLKERMELVDKMTKETLTACLGLSLNAKTTKLLTSQDGLEKPNESEEMPEQTTEWLWSSDGERLLIKRTLC
jgi:hypothetical protein